MPAICVPISSVALAVWPASALTSCATTAKPLPASPARAASMVALSASRLVCSAIAVISFTTSPMRPAACDSSVMRASVFSACFTASPAMRLDSCTCRLISVTEAVISSVARGDRLDIGRGLLGGRRHRCRRAAAWSRRVLVRVPAAASSSVEADDTVVDDVADRRSRTRRRASACWPCAGRRVPPPRAWPLPASRSPRAPRSRG